MKDHDAFNPDEEIVVKGGGGKPSAPSEADDTLRSKAVASFVELLGEGENLGLLNGLRSVFLNGTPLQNENGTFNFKGITVEERKGTVDQPPLNTVPGSESETTVMTEVTQQLGPVVRTTQNNILDAVRVRIQVPSLLEIQEDGDVRPTDVDFRIEWKPTSSNTWIRYQNQDLIIQGKTRSTYETSYRINLSGTGPWDIRVTRISVDDSSGDGVTRENQLIFAGITEVLNEKFTYPYCHVLGVRVDTELFGSGTPKRGYHIGGRIIEVPANFDPETRTYTGFWNGTWKLACTDDPAWCYRDLLRNKRYGLGRRIPALYIDDATLYVISQRCSDKVPDGYGGEEFRFSCNLVINTQKEAYNVMNDMASIFFGLTYWSAGSLTLSHDAPAPMEMIVTNSNVLGGEFVWTGTPLKTRANAVIVSYNDKDDLYRQAIEIEQADHLTARYGYRPRQVTAFGCNSRGQAKRLARWILYSEQMEDATVTYRAGEDHAWVKPGTVIGIVDRHMDEVRYSGRARSYSGSSVIVDAVGQAQNGDVFLFVNPDGVVAERTVTGVNAATNTLTLSANLPAGLPDHFVWAVQNSSHEPVKMRVLASRQVEDGVYEVSALKYADDKFTQIDNGLDFTEDPGNVGTKGPIKAPINLALSMYSKRVSGTSDRLFAMISWSSENDTRVRNYQVQYRHNSDGWKNLITTETNMAEMPVVRGDTYQFRVRSLATEDRQSIWVYTASVVARIPRGPIAPVSQFEAESRLKAVFLKWINPDDPALKNVTVFVSPTSNFSEATKLGESTGSFFEHVTGDTITRWYWVQTISHNNNQDASSRRGPLAVAGSLTGVWDLDDVPPEVPEGLTLSTRLLDNGMAMVRAEWEAPEADAIYDLLIEIENGNPISATIPTTYHEWQVPRNVLVTVSVRARDRMSNLSLYSQTESIRSATDTVAPAVPTGLKTMGSFESIWATWNRNSEGDFHHYELYVSSNTTAPTSSTVPTTSVNGNTILIKDLPEVATRYFWVRAVDSSGNPSAWSARVEGKTVTVSGLIESQIERATWASDLGFIKLHTGAALPTVNIGPTISWNGKLYTWDGTKYTSATAIDGVTFENITGTLSGAQIPEGILSVEMLSPGLEDFILAQGTSADGAAAAAAGHADRASSFADDAGQYASAASGSATLASTKAGEANTSALQASQAVSDAAGEVVKAAQSATTAGTILGTARRAMNLSTVLLTGTPDPALEAFGFSGTGTVAAYAVASEASYGTDTDGQYIQRDSTANNRAVLLRGLSPSSAEKVYKVTAKLKSSHPMNLRLSANWLRSDGTSVASGSYVTTLFEANQVGTITMVIGSQAGGLVTQVGTTPANWTTAVGIRFGVQVVTGVASSNYKLYDIKVEDYTAADQAARQAKLSSDSADAASRSYEAIVVLEDNAETYAAAALGHSTSATSAAGLATTKAGESSQSATNAAGSASAAQSFAQLAAFALGGGMNKNPIFQYWNAADTALLNMSMFGTSYGNFAKVPGKYGNAVRMNVTGTGGTGPYLQTAYASGQQQGPRNPSKILVTVEVEPVSGTLGGVGIDALWARNGVNYAIGKKFSGDLDIGGGIQTFQIVLERPSGVGDGAITDFQIRMFASHTMDGGVRSTGQIIVHRFDANEIKADSYISEQRKVAADLAGFVSSSYVMRLKSGGASAGFEMVAASDPTGAASAIRMDADEILLNGTVRAALLAAGAITADKMAIGDLNNYLDQYWDAQKSPMAPFNGATISTGQQHNGQNSITIPSGTTSMTPAWCRRQAIACSPGDKFKIKFVARKTSDWNGGGNSKLRMGSNNSGGGTHYFSITYEASDFANTSWREFEAEFTIPDGVNQFFPCFLSDATAGSVFINRIQLRNMIGGVLIEGGSLTATHLITTEAVLTNSAQIADLIVKSGHIESMTAAKLEAGTAMAGSITVDGRTVSSFGIDSLFDDITQNWKQLTGQGSSYYTGSALAGTTGSRVLMSRADGVQWHESPEIVPFDPNKLYKVTYSVRRHSGTDGSMYLGVEGFAADKTTRVNQNGADTWSSQFWLGAALPQADIPWNFTERVAYIKGTSTNFAGAGTVANPKGLHPDVRYLRPLVIFNFNLTSGGCQMVLNHVKIEVVSEEAAEVVNAGATLIDPGKVRIYGSTTVADWRKGGDETRIDGGNLSANTVQANALEIGSRNITLTGIQFEHNRPGNNDVWWSGGSVRWINDNGDAATTSISGGSASWTSGVLYIFWTKGQTSLGWSTNLATAMSMNRVVLATYQGGKLLDPDYGRTVIDGSDLKTGTVTANKMNVINLSSVTATIGILRTATSGQRMEIHTDRIMVYDANNVLRVRIGNLG